MEQVDPTSPNISHQTNPGKGGKGSKKDGEAAQQQLSPDQQEKLRQAMEMLSMQNQVKQIREVKYQIFTNSITECTQKRGRCKQEKLPVLVNSAGESFG